MTDDADAVASVRSMVFAYRMSQAVHVCAELRISDLVADGPRTAAALAASTDTDESALRRLLRAVSALGLYHEDPADTFANTTLGETLRTDHETRLGDIARNVGRPYFWETWGHLLETIQTGENTFRRLYGTSVWEHRAAHPDDGVAFDRAMTAMSRYVVDGVSAAFDPKDSTTVIDIGGGQGTLVAAILRVNPRLRGALFDQPDVVAGSTALLTAAGVADRCDVLSGSFFEAVPAGFDVYLLKSILHDWDDDTCVDILRACRQAMPPGARCVVVERVLPGANEGVDAKFSDLNMMVMPGGRERTADEYGALFEHAGMRLVEVTPTGSDFALIEATLS